MRFNGTAEEALDLSSKLRRVQAHAVIYNSSFLTSRENYMSAYGGYQQSYKGNLGTFFEDLKEDYPRMTECDGTFYYPITRIEAAVHMLEIPFYHVPFYINSKDEQVQTITQWRLERGE